VSRRIEIDLPGWLDDALDTPRAAATAEDRMRLAVWIAERNVAEGTGGPFGAVVVEAATGQVVSAGANLVLPSANCTAHAEMVAIELAERVRGSYDLGMAGLPALELVTSVEPCAMCIGALVWSGVTSLVCGAGSGAAADIGFDEGPRARDWVNQLECRGISVRRDVLADEAARVLQRYAAGGGPIYNPGR
jgi:tRNA(Arg) A34 adenosine deaminase TadA